MAETRVWTFDSLAYHLEAMFEQLQIQVTHREDAARLALAVAYQAHEVALARQREEIQAALITTEKAIDKADHANDKRFDSVNAFRAQLTEQTRTFMARTEIEARNESLNRRLDEAILRINDNALAIERANVAGQTIYVLRSESVAAARTMDEKIVSSATAANNRIESTINRVRDVELRMQSQPTREEAAIALTAANSKAEASIANTAEKLSGLTDRVAAMELRLTSRLDLSSGKNQGISAAWGYLVGAVGVIASVIVIAVRATGN